MDDYDDYPKRRGYVHPILVDPIRNPDEYIRHNQAGLPKDPDALVEKAKDILIAYDDIRSLEGEGRDALSLQRAAVILSFELEAVVWRLNEGTGFGCWEKRLWLMDQLEAPDGEVPIWGQPGRFLVTVEDMRVLVEYRGLEGRESLGGNYGLSHSFGAHIVDVLRPFLSNTGYRSFIPGCDHSLGGGVDEAAKRRLYGYLTSKEYREAYRGKRIFLNEADVQHRLAQQAKDPAFGPDGWIKTTKLPLLPKVEAPIAHKLPIEMPAKAQLPLHTEEDMEDEEDDE